MNPVLIFTDNQKINTQKKALDNCVSLFQSIYDAFQAISITLSIQDINDLISWKKGGNGGPNFVQKFAINKILDAAGSLVIFPGITLRRDDVINMMETKPDVSAIDKILDNTPNLYSAWDINSSKINLLTLVNGVISKVADSDTQIESEFTYYTRTDASAQLATAMFTFCDAINTLEASIDQISRPSGFDINPDFVSGLVKRGDEYGISVGFIRGYENQLSH